MSTGASPSMALLAALGLVLGALPDPLLAAPRVQAEVTCVATHEALEYDCTIRLTDRATAAPIGGATVVVSADMPSMPMAHTVRPVTASADAALGVYRAKLALEMHGRWALRLQVSGPVRDLVVHVEEFAPGAPGGQQAPGGHPGHGGHGAHPGPGSIHPPAKGH